MTNAVLDVRQEKGRILATDKRIKRIVGATWAVPSQGGQTAYIVNELAATCSCPDYETRRVKCKHQWAIRFAKTVETAPDGTQVTTESVKIVRRTYSQDWPAYNAAQVSEKETGLALLRGLCDRIQAPARKVRGRKPIAYSDAAYAMTMKVWTTVSARRANSDINACASDGHLAREVSCNSLLDYFDKPEMTPILIKLIEESAAPLATVETAFAIDSTGFGTNVYRRWFDAKYGREMAESTWIKCHAVVGTKTNVITAVSITDSTAHDSPQLPALVASTGQRFKMAEVSGDKAYLSNANLTAIEAVGAAPFVPFKSNSHSGGSPAWRRMWGLFMYQQDEFQAHYHKRSNVESTFSGIKRKFGGAVRSKKFTAQVNEILCKVLAWNLTCLVQAMHELGIEPSFAMRAAS